MKRHGESTKMKLKRIGPIASRIKWVGGEGVRDVLCGKRKEENSKKIKGK